MIEDDLKRLNRSRRMVEEDNEEEEEEEGGGRRSKGKWTTGEKRKRGNKRDKPDLITFTVG